MDLAYCLVRFAEFRCVWLLNRHTVALSPVWAMVTVSLLSPLGHDTDVLALFRMSSPAGRGL